MQSENQQHCDYTQNWIRLHAGGIELVSFKQDAKQAKDWIKLQACCIEAGVPQITRYTGQKLN